MSSLHAITALGSIAIIWIALWAVIDAIRLHREHISPAAPIVPHTPSPAEERGGANREIVG